MLTIDGVIAGNYRTGFSGLDINRMFGPNAKKRLNPEAYLLRDLAKAEKKVSFFFDIHGHSNRKSIFMYGPRYPLHSEHYASIRFLPKLVQERSQMFRYFSCRFANEKTKQNCSRLCLNRELNLPQSYTLEASMFAWLDRETRQTHQLDPLSLINFGK